jgi:predicted DsbA family dithiol-disulfide isomerase
MTPQNPPKKTVEIEVWSDVVCPWCYIGKRRLETALSRFERQDLVRVTWRSYQLNPSAPKTTQEATRDMLARTYGVSTAQADAMQARVTGVAAQEGLRYKLELTRSENTFDAHRLLHLAKEHGVQDALKERLFAAYFTEGASLGDTDTLTGLAVQAGLDRDLVAGVLARGDFADAVREDAQRATALGIQGVPFFVIDGRLGVSGAQPAEVLLQALEEAVEDVEKEQE